MGAANSLRPARYKPMSLFSDPAAIHDPFSAPAAKRRVPGRSGWLVGVVFGVLIGLWAIPPVRYTLHSQLEFLLAEDSIPWMRALDTRRNEQEITRLNTTAATVPDDYLMQVGRATVHGPSRPRTTPRPIKRTTTGR